MNKFIVTLVGVALLAGACAKSTRKAAPPGAAQLPKVPAEARKDPADENSPMKDYTSREVLFNLYTSPRVQAALQAAEMEVDQTKIQFVQYTFKDGSMVEMVEFGRGDYEDSEPIPFDDVNIRLTWPMSQLTKQTWNLRYTRPDKSEVNIGQFSVARKDRTSDENTALNGLPVVEDLCTVQPSGLDYSKRCEFGWGFNDEPTIWVYNMILK